MNVNVTEPGVRGPARYGVTEMLCCTTVCKNNDQDVFFLDNELSKYTTNFIRYLQAHLVSSSPLLMVSLIILNVFLT